MDEKQKSILKEANSKTAIVILVASCLAIVRVPEEKDTRAFCVALPMHDPHGAHIYIYIYICIYIRTYSYVLLYICLLLRFKKRACRSFTQETKNCNDIPVFSICLKQGVFNRGDQELLLSFWFPQKTRQRGLPKHDTPTVNITRNLCFFSGRENRTRVAHRRITQLAARQPTLAHANCPCASGTNAGLRVSLIVRKPPRS